ncbi:YopX family protein [Enterococcus faecalis]|uniref:YopX family protein n=1 Tax=Enterococcus faecalis TaxID=1351 RepID=UPI003D7592FC
MIPKFRAYYAEKMWYVAKIDLWGDPEQTTCDLAPYLPKYDELFDIPLIETALMQSTGLKDKNGVEIFEGDVLYYIPFESHINDSIVVFEKGSFCKKMLRNGKLTSVRFIDSEEYEVIGNVYENPELLEGTE